MVNVEFRRSDTSITLEIKGHAGYAEFGKDVVCSAASILSLTLAQVVNDYFRQNKLQCKPTIIREEGHALIACKPNDDTYGDAMNMFLFAQTGYALLEYNYPHYLSLKRFETEQSDQ